MCNQVLQNGGVHICSLRQIRSELQAEQGSRVLIVQSNSSGKPVACHRSFGPTWPERFSLVLISLRALWTHSAMIHDGQKMRKEHEYIETIF